jgi:membrane fusion protein (multidrug efflux system)
MKPRWKIISIPIILIVAAAIFLYFKMSAGKSQADPRANRMAPVVHLEKPNEQTVLESLSFTGDVAAIQEAAVYAKVTGTLEGVFVNIGAEVGHGQLLALIDTTELAQQYLQTSATYINARANYNRIKELAEQNLVARQDQDNAEATSKVAFAAFETARTRLGYARITAPFAGFITKRFLDPGAVVSTNNATLFTLMDLNQLKIMVNVLEKDIPKITKGKKATITVDAFPKQQFEGTVTRYSEAVDQATRTMAVEIDINNPQHILKPGMFANVRLIVEERPHALTLPTAAILQNDAGSYVLTAVNDTARRVPVTVGLEQNGRTEILTGLALTTQVITTGQQFAKIDGPVNVQQ